MNTVFGIFRYWDSGYDEDLMEDRIAMNLLFLQVKCHLEATFHHYIVFVKMALLVVLTQTLQCIGLTRLQFYMQFSVIFALTDICFFSKNVAVFKKYFVLLLIFTLDFTKTACVIVYWRQNVEVKAFLPSSGECRKVEREVEAQ